MQYRRDNRVMEDRRLRKIVRQMGKYAVFGGMALFVGVLPSCSLTQVVESDGRVYHCIATDMPVPPPNTFAKKQPLELLEYGDYQDRDRPTTGRSSYCNILQVPNTAYLRYRVDGLVIEKRLDLSTLTAQRVYKKTVEFYVDGDAVEVRLVTPAPGTRSMKEIILRR